MSRPPSLEPSLYRDHLALLQQGAEAALAATGHEALVIASGIEKFAFLDDRPYGFQPNPHFKHWVPLNQHPHSWLAVRPGRKLRVVVHLPADFWHVPPSPPTGEWVEAVELVVIREPDEAVAALKDVLGPRTAVIGEADPESAIDLLAEALTASQAERVGVWLDGKAQAAAEEVTA